MDRMDHGAGAKNFAARFVGFSARQIERSEHIIPAA